jgi:hypothetical protein
MMFMYVCCMYVCMYVFVEAVDHPPKDGSKEVKWGGGRPVCLRVYACVCMYVWAQSGLTRTVQ